MGKYKVIYNPIEQKFDYVLNPSETAVENVDLSKTCDVGVSVGDPVFESPTVANKVETAVDNTGIYPVIGFVASKPTTTTCMVRVLGELSGFSGLTKGQRVFLGTTGGVSVGPILTDYVQILGVAIDTDKIFINVNLQRVLRLGN